VTFPVVTCGGGSARLPATAPAAGSAIAKVVEPATGCESAAMIRYVAVYVPSGRFGRSAIASAWSSPSGRKIEPVSTSLPAGS
jgi:hypothetical protein